ncbi:hypothetical protein LCGC14_2421050 [marine sediment metagenome]|uniref:Carboxymuconolactone decarboxylase-like domain-containing protein n=1 Tax=marine sediment metagenome TaxID=412755 RepID=A0A0F9BPR8_9ZZZZ
MRNRDRENIGKVDNKNNRRLDKPRVPPINEVDFIKELYHFNKAMIHLQFGKQESFESEWGREMHSLVQWLKNYNESMLNDLSSFLKLKEKGLDIDSINFDDYKDSIKSFIYENGSIYNIRATMTMHRRLRLKWILMASHVTYDSSLPPRDKEILILRNAWLCRCDYEWDHHVFVGKRTGLSSEEIDHIKIGPDAQDWSPFDRTLLQAVDELHKNKIISDETWKSLSERYDTQQLMDLIMVVGAYNMLAMFMNSFGLQTEDCVKKLLD